LYSIISINSFSAFKFKWLLENVASVRDAMNDDRLMFGNVDSWLIWNLTGGVSRTDNHVTDVTNASRTMLMDLKVIHFTHGT
jgi:glycerol kinase